MNLTQVFADDIWSDIRVKVFKYFFDRKIHDAWYGTYDTYISRANVGARIGIASSVVIERICEEIDR